MTEEQSPEKPAADPTDAVWRRQEIESPCVKICMLHPATGYCVGCGRTGDEIAGWTRFTTEQRAAIRGLLPGRMAEKTPRAERPSARRRQRSP